MNMKKCNNCHQPAKKLNTENQCENCFDAKHPDAVFDVAYDYDKGNDNTSRKVKEMKQ